MYTTVKKLLRSIGSNEQIAIDMESKANTVYSWERLNRLPAKIAIRLVELYEIDLDDIKHLIG